ncbi:MAG: hypothetical protein V2I33_18345 [Kangiellaceae bacterium]|jgi:hypothetical protein|nr:hypothetical protein [Kangiellaceae bacterium]
MVDVEEGIDEVEDVDEEGNATNGGDFIRLLSVRLGVVCRALAINRDPLPTSIPSCLDLLRALRHKFRELDPDTCYEECHAEWYGIRVEDLEQAAEKSGILLLLLDEVVQPWDDLTQRFHSQPFQPELPIHMLQHKLSHRPRSATTINIPAIRLILLVHQLLEELEDVNPRHRLLTAHAEPSIHMHDLVVVELPLLFIVNDTSSLLFVVTVAFGRAVKADGTVAQGVKRLVED